MDTARLLREIDMVMRVDGVSRAELSRRLGMTPGGVSNFFRRGVIRVDRLERIGGVLGLELRFVRKEVDDGQA